METPALTSAQPTERCSICYKDVATDDAFCQNCGYPLQGSEQEQKNFRLQHDFKSIDVNMYNEKVRKAGNSLYWLAGIFVVSGLVFYFTNQEAEGAIAALVIYLILAMLFLGLGGYSRKKPLACIVSGLALYAILVILNAIADPVSIVRGIIFKIAIIGLLINGLKSALEVEKLKKEGGLS